MDEIACAANLSPSEHACLVRGRHLTTCPDPLDCAGCQPRPAVHGYLCRSHYERWERAWTTLGRLHDLLATIGNGRAIQTEPSASTSPGPRLPLSALQLDLDELERTWTGDPTTEDGAVLALAWARAVFAVARTHPTEPRKERLTRVRCGSCNQVAVITVPPAIFRGDTTLRCVSCGWTSHDQDHAEAAAYTEALERDPYRPRRRAAVREQPLGLERLVAVAALARALA